MQDFFSTFFVGVLWSNFAPGCYGHWSRYRSWLAKISTRVERQKKDELYSNSSYDILLKMVK